MKISVEDFEVLKVAERSFEEGSIPEKGVDISKDTKNNCSIITDKETSKQEFYEFKDNIVSQKKKNRFEV